MLEVRNISKSFYRKEALNDVSFTVGKGEIFGLLGPNGAGKTTMIRVINRIVESDSGSVRINGDLMVNDDLKHIGYLPEERGLYKNMTVEAHAMFLGRLRGLPKADVNTKIDYWFDRFEINDWRKKRIEQLSKGMAQKVQFICTVLHEPKLLILDEPFSGFDPVNVELIKQELIEMKAAGKTIILSSHNMKSVEEICDRVVLIDKAKKVAEGSIADLQEERKAGLYAVKFRGSMIAFVNALWTGFEVIDKDIHGGDKFTVRLKMRNESSFDDLLKVLIGQVKIEAAWEVLPSMQDVFIDIVQPRKENEDEK
ncbi:ATP-binding cassette domain-containing protein [Crocinitomicaceae bacterium]|nr:ATP-binding cassette domain-containing protein [Crocinitomicaceae bacterium]MDC0099176.1 ATP-binding cassette domain-containing protein [Crocinitomicaceae bacterium]MDC1384673.1 ATP-binding cassette domain-containing protein [Crocinitomicaceae bacterium]|tara:strand:- start:1567 stop:2499 length:933 start_codon:yes stop_codon:yes gene_type:complete